MGRFASSDRTRRWTCWVQVCASTGKSRMALPTTTGSTRHDDQSVNSNMSASRSAHGPRGTQPYAAGTAAGMSVVRTLKQSFGGTAARRPKRKHDDPEQTSARSREAEQSKAGRKVQNAVCGTDLRGKDSDDEAFQATRKSGPHVARRNPRPCRRQGGQPSSGIIYLHAQCLEGEESSSEWGWVSQTTRST